MTSIKLEFEITRDEYIEAVWVMRGKSKDWYKPLRIGGFVCDTIGLALLFEDSNGWFAPTLLEAFGFLASTYPWLRFNQEREWGWNKYSRIGATVWEFSEDNVIFESAVCGWWWSWEAFDRFTESTNLFLLFRGDQPSLIAKRSFADAAQHSEFCAFMLHKSGRPTGGFPIQPK